MGKLIEKLNRIGRSGGPRLGFGQSGGAGAPQLAIIASLDAADRTLAKAVVANGADAVVVSGSGAKAPKGPAAKKLGLNDAVPCGGGGRALEANPPTSWDFAVVTTDGPLEALVEATDVDLVLSLPSDAPDSMVRSLEALPIDAVAVPGPNHGLTLDALVPCCRIARATRKPVLAFVSVEIDRPSLLALRDAGAAGVIVDVAKGQEDAVASLRKRILDLPPKAAKKQSARLAVSLGLLSQVTGDEPVDEPDDEPDHEPDYEPGDEPDYEPDHEPDEEDRRR